MFDAYQFLSDLYYVATTRFVGLRLFILLVEFISVFIIVGVVSRSFGVDAVAD